MHINYSATQNISTMRQIFEKLVRVVHHIFLLFVRICFIIFYGKGKRVTPVKDDILLESVTSLAAKIRTKKLKSVDVVKAFIERIKEINPTLNCVVDDRFQDALTDASQADSLIDSRVFTEEQLANEKPLLGVPFTTKEAIKVKNMLNTTGVLERKGIRADKDATCIKLLREAGAIPLAITNVPELSMWWETNNPIYGKTNNPYNTNRIAGGSSGGEGSILAAAGSPFGLGSDVGGSIRLPAFFCGIFGHKPTKCLVSNQGQFPPQFEEIESFLSIGPMCRYSKDLKLIFKIIAADKMKILNLDVPVDLKNVKFFYQTDDGGDLFVQSVEKSLSDALLTVIKYLENNFEGSTERAQLEKFRESTEIWCSTMRESFTKTSDMPKGNFSKRIKPYVDYGKALVKQSNFAFMEFINIISSIKYGSEVNSVFTKKRNELLKDIQGLLGNNGVLLYPLHPTVAPYHWETYAKIFNFSYTGIFNCLGLPCTAVPLGLSKDGLPIGIQVIANLNQDRLCFAVAEELEKAFGGWVQPV